MNLHLYNLAVSWALLSLIWLVQTIIYPGFASIPAADFVGYHRWYVKRISAVVTPLMIGEALIAVAWLQGESFSLLSSLSAFLVAIVWISTFVLQVPIHRHLEAGKDLPAIRRLVATNWIRTASWSIKTLALTVDAAGGL